jgi:HEAT repeat protein
MKHTLTTLIAVIALGGTAQAQTAPTAPTAPKKAPTARPATPPQPKAPADVEDRDATGDEGLAIAALEGLMAQPSERALPILKKVLAGSHSTLIKRRALFVLGQIDGAEAQQILMQTIRSNNDALRGEAIRAIGIGGDPKALDALQEVYKSGGPDVKRDVLQAWMIAGRKEPIYQAALNAATEDEAEAAINMLGVMGASDELRKLADRPNASKGLLNAYAISGDLESLRKLAEGSDDRQVRIEAVQKIGIIQSDAARTALREIYTRSTDPAIRDAAVQGMFIAQDEQGLLALYRGAKNGDEKRALLRYLSMINGDAAIQAIDAALEEKK